LTARSAISPPTLLPAQLAVSAATIAARHCRLLAMSRLETLPNIGAPATRAPANAGITSLGQLAGYPRAELAALHGMDPKALSVLEDATRQADPYGWT
jgi:hypothetical protein